MRLHKFLKILCPVLALLLLTGCGSIKEKIKDVASGVKDQVTSAVEENTEKNPYQSPHKYAVAIFNEVLEHVEAKDSQAIFNIFSDYAKTNADLMPQIEKLVEFMDGEIVEMRHVGASNDYSSVRDGVTVRAAYTASTFVTTDKETLYWVNVGVITADEDETKLGLYYIEILNSTLSSAHTDAWVEWRTNNFDDKEAEPKIPDNMKVTVNY